MTSPSQLDSQVLAHFLVGFEGTTLTGELQELLARGLAGVALYRRNWTDVESLCKLTAEIRAAAGRPVLIGIDQEGGTKFSLPAPFTEWPSPAELGCLDDPAVVERVAIAIAKELRAAGVNLNFAPMLDLHVHSESPVTKIRSYGGKPDRVGTLGAAVIRGLREGGVLACAKHFPGHGDALLDPHEDLPVFRGTMQRLDAMELVPFAAAIRQGVSLIMTAHILLPEIEPGRPASLSRKLIHEILRERMRFNGLVLADDLGMGAIRKRFGVGDAAIRAIQAGSDVVMLCHDWSVVRPAIDAMAEARARRDLDESEWQASLGRIERARNAQGDQETSDAARAAMTREPSLKLIGCAEHRALAAEIRTRL
jgi:beta-N-acetylhexosaminidase